MIDLTLFTIFTCSIVFIGFIGYFIYLEVELPSSSFEIFPLIIICKSFHRL